MKNNGDFNDNSRKDKQTFNKAKANADAEQEAQKTANEPEDKSALSDVRSKQEDIFQRMNHMTRAQYNKQMRSHNRFNRSGSATGKNHMESGDISRIANRFRGDGSPEERELAILKNKERRIENHQTYRDKVSPFNNRTLHEKYKDKADNTKNDFWKGVFKMMSADYDRLSSLHPFERYEPKQRRLDMIARKKRGVTAKWDKKAEEYEKADDIIQDFEKQRKFDKEHGINHNPSEKFDEDYQNQNQQNHNDKFSDGVSVKLGGNGNGNFNPFMDVPGPSTDNGPEL